MKNTYRTAFMAACFLPGLLLPAANPETIPAGPPSLLQLCFNAAAYRSAQPKKLHIDTDSSNMIMAIEITSRSNSLFSSSNIDAILGSVQELSIKHLEITGHFMPTNEGYEISTPELRPSERSPAEPIAEYLTYIENRLLSNRLGIHECDFLLDNQSFERFSNDHRTRLKRLAKLQTQVETHFSRLCESNVDPNAISVFEKQKSALSKTVSDAISLTRQHKKDLKRYRQIIRDICAEHNIEQKLANLKEEAEAAEAIRQVEVAQELQRQRDEHELWMANSQTKHELWMANSKRKHELWMANSKRKHELYLARADRIDFILAAGLITVWTAALTVASNEYLTGSLPKSDLSKAVAFFAPIAFPIITFSLIGPEKNKNDIKFGTSYRFYTGILTAVASATAFACSAPVRAALKKLFNQTL